MSKIIGYPLGLIMWLLYQVTHNYAWSIIIFTLIVKILMFPLSVKQQKSTAAMSAFQPKLDKLKKQYANNQQKLQEEQMKLYAEEGINPMASCLPMLLPFPILYGVIDVVYRPISHIIRAGQDIILKATQITEGILSAGGAVVPTRFKTYPEIYVVKAMQNDPSAFSELGDPEFVQSVVDFNNKFLGIVDLGDTPTLHPEVWNAAAVILLMIPIMSGVVQLIFTIYSQIRTKKMNPDAPSMAGMNIMFYTMPLISVWISYSCPAGAGFYWTFSALFSLLQSILLYKIYTPEYVASLVEKDRAKRKKKSRPNMMERYRQLMEEQMAQQNGGTSQAPQKSGGIAVSSSSDEEDKPEVKLSKSKQKEYERMIIREARRRQAEKYGEEFVDDDE